jgi:hypothetical protein
MFVFLYKDPATSIDLHFYLYPPLSCPIGVYDVSGKEEKE